MSGNIGYLASEKVPNEIKHAFPLFSVNVQYKITPTIRAYAGWAQAYRSVIFSDVIPPTALDITDPNLKDTFGNNAEVGVGGTIEYRLSFDVSYFQI